MSDQDDQKANGDKGKNGLPTKTIAIVLVMLVAEAVIVLGAVTMLGKPSEVQGVGLEEGHHIEGDRLLEIPIVREKFTNNSSGRVWIWDAEIVVVAKLKHAGPAPVKGGDDDGHGGGGDGEDDHGHGPTLRSELAARRAEVRTGIGAIWSGAQHSYFTEPGRETLSRQVLEYLRNLFGQDAEGDERIHAVLIPKCLGFPADY